MKLRDPAEFARSLVVQRSAWGLNDSGGVPAHVLIAAQYHSGLVLGAYDGHHMIGVLFGFTALSHGRPYHYSHINAIVRSYQSRGVGFRLKLSQRRHVISQGQSLVKWTYDPLQASNAFFNIRKLGAICRTYKPNLYGVLDDSLNRGRLTDRFEVEWWVRTRRVAERIRGRHAQPSLDEVLSQGASLVNMTERSPLGVRRIKQVRLGLSNRLLLAEIPENIVKVAKRSGALAANWTLSTRKVFESYFRKNYVVTDVILERADRGRRVFYLLEHGFQQ